MLVLLAGALLQLAYLNRALRLVGPTLVCPLAFCFYNVSSIISGVIYYDQFDEMSSLQIGLVVLGTAVLLAGVWIVSFKVEPARSESAPGDESAWTAERVPLLVDEPRGYSDDGNGEEDEGDDSASRSDSEDEEPLEWVPRGLTIGLGAASPGFDIRPAHRPHQRNLHRRSVSLTHSADHRTSPSIAPVITPLARTGDEVDGVGLLDRTASEADVGTAADEVDRRRAWREHHHHHSHHRTTSLSGALYVGRRDSAPPVPFGRSTTMTPGGGGSGCSEDGQHSRAHSSPRRDVRVFTPLTSTTD